MFKKNNAKINTILFLLSICASLTWCLNFRESTNAPVDTYIVQFLFNLQSSISSKALISSMLVMFFYMLAKKYVSSKVFTNKLIWACDLILASICTAAASFKIDDSLQHLFNYPGQITKSIIFFVGTAFFLHLCAIVLYEALETHISFGVIKLDSRHLTTFFRFWSAHFFICTAVFIFICWLPQLIIYYPGYSCPDSWSQIYQFWNPNLLTAHHPVVDTLTIGFFSWLGVQLWQNGHAGLYIFVCVQTVVFAAIASYLLVLLRDIKAPRWLHVATIFLILFTPFFPNMATYIIKDALFSISVLLFMIELAYALIDPKEFTTSKRHLLLAYLGMLGTIFYRNNGRHMLYPTLLVLVILLFTKYKKLDKKIRRTLLLVVVLPVLTAEITNAYINAIYHPPKFHSVYVLALPLQQTGRYVKKYYQEVTPEEKDVIDKLVDYEAVKNDYFPTHSRNIVNTHRKVVASADYIAYFKVWWQMFLKHPVVYINAAINQDYALVDPFIVYSYIGTSYTYNSESVVAKLSKDLGEYVQNERLLQLQAAARRYYSLLISLPVINIICHANVYVLGTIYLSLFAIIKKRTSCLILAMPMILNILVVIVAPVVNVRYYLPVIYCFPVLASYYHYLAGSHKILKRKRK